MIKNIKSKTLCQSVRIYWGHSNRRGAIEGTLTNDANYVHWFIQNVACIPTSTKTCELSSNIFADRTDLKGLCGKYMFFPAITFPPDTTDRQSIFNFKIKLSSNDYFDLLEKIHQDEKNYKENLDRIQMIYNHILEDISAWSVDECKSIKTRVKSLHLLTDNDQWKLTNNLYFYMESHGSNYHLNDSIPCLRLDFKNKSHSQLNQFLELLNIKQIRSNDLKLGDKKSSFAGQFRQKLIDISPFLKKWLKKSVFPSEIISMIDRKIQQDNSFIESDRLELYYNGIFIEETNVYFDYKHQQLYVQRPWYSETTCIDLPNKLCQLLNIRGFEKKIRFLLKATIEEIRQHFTTKCVEIPTKEYIVIMPSVIKSGFKKSVFFHFVYQISI